MHTKRILAIFAHPDDEFTSAGLITRLINADSEICLVCATKGEAGRIRNTKTELDHQIEISKIREKEFINSCEHLKINEYYFLDLIDGQSTDWNIEKTIETIMDRIRHFNPTYLISFDKHGGNGHPDHREISKITHAIHNQLNGTKLIQISLYPTKFIQNKLWWLPRKIKLKIMSKMCRNDIENFKIVKLSRKELKSKMKLTDIYKSQFPDEKNRYFGQPRFILKLLGKYECYEIQENTILEEL